MSHGVISSFRTSFSDLKPQIQQIKLLKEKYNIWVHFLSRVRWEDCWSVVYFALCNYTFYMRFSQRYLNNRIQTLIYSVSLTLGISLIWGAYFMGLSLLPSATCALLFSKSLLIHETTPTTVSELTTYMLKMAMYLQNKLAAFTFSFAGI